MPFHPVLSNRERNGAGTIDAYRVTGRSPPQKKWTGLLRPLKAATFALWREQASRRVVIVIPSFQLRVVSGNVLLDYRNG
jgi:hypothetical protein